MAKENMFKKAAQTRQTEQKEIKAKLSEKTDDDVPRTTICISLSAEEKYQLKLISAKRNKTVSRLIQDWIAENWEE